MNVLQSVPITTVARGCFLEGSMVATPNGQVAIEKLKPGDEVISYNEVTKQEEVSVIGDIDVLVKDHHWIINRVTRVTGEHPMYTERGIVEVQNLRESDVLVGRNNNFEVNSLARKDGVFTVYNLLDVTPNHNYYVNNLLVHNKGGGGCFLAGTAIETPKGTVSIEDMKSGDEVWSRNEQTGKLEVAIVERLDVLAAREYYTLNHEVNVTAEHPFYTYNLANKQYVIKKVSELKLGDDLLNINGNQVPLRSIRIHKQDVVIYNLINVEPNHNYFAAGYLVHNKGGIGGGARGGGGARSSGTSKSSSSSKSTSTPSKPKVGVSTAKPGSTIKTADGKTVKSSTATPAKPGYSKTSKGIVGDNGYTPRFTNGYSAPAGSTVYYRDTSALDYLPWIYLFSQDNPATPQGQTATIVQPDGKQVEAKPVPQGTDGLAVLNWFLLIMIIAGIIGGIIWGVNKLTTKEKPKPKIPRYGSYY